MIKDYRDYRRFGFTRRSSLIQAFWDLPVLRKF